MKLVQESTDHSQLYSEEVDIRSYPSPIIPLPEDSHVDLCIGDLHANAFKLIRFLVKHSVFKISPDDYRVIADHYFVLSNIDERTSKGAINRAKFAFCEILDRIEVNQGARILIIGDETQDRGNDYAMLKVYAKMLAAKILVETDASNHGYEFVRSYEAYRNYTHKELVPMIMRNGHGRSTLLLQRMLKLGCIGVHELVEMVEESYLPTLRAISYSIDESTNTLVFYHHAPSALTAVYFLAKKWQVEPIFNFMKEGFCARDIANTIDAINLKYREHVKNRSLSSLADPKILQCGYDGLTINPAEFPFEYLLWNRNCADLVRPAQLNEVKILYVHGHHEVNQAELPPHIIGLDSTFGKAFCEPHFRGVSLTLMVTCQRELRNELKDSSDTLNKYPVPEPTLKKTRNALPFFDTENLESEHVGQEHAEDEEEVATLATDVQLL